ncbi:hypothetical protein [Streptomyces virginiae]
MGLRKSDFTPPEQGWGQAVLSTSSPHADSCWTDSGESYDPRGRGLFRGARGGGALSEE